ncbi:MAG: SgcJ/EcaC family oxidoreductase [Pseudomonadota bacterium]
MMRLFPLLCLLLAACATAPTPSSLAADDAAIRAHGQTWLKHYTAGDLDALMALYTDDAVVALHDQPALRGKPAIRAYFARSAGKADVTFKLDIEQIDINGDLAWITSKYWLRSVSNGSGYVYEDAGRSLIIYRREADGVWRLAADIDNNTPDVTMETMPGGTS